MTDTFYDKWSGWFAAAWLSLVAIGVEIVLIIEGQWYVLPLSLLWCLGIFLTIAAVAILSDKWSNS